MSRHLTYYRKNGKYLERSALSAFLALPVGSIQLLKSFLRGGHFLLKLNGSGYALFVAVRVHFLPLTKFMAIRSALGNAA
jgi:hypothetical protein